MENTPKLLEALEWYKGSASSIDADQYCSTRDVFEGRLSRLPLNAQKHIGISESDSFLLAASIGEIGNNCFDHNLGHWKNEPGIYFGYNFKQNEGLLWIADRGRGVYESLHAVHKEIGTPQQALEIAFDKKISGRFPERRGNGLKFVRQIINCDQKRGLWCRSNDAEVSFGKLRVLASDAAKTINHIPCSGGTITIISWCNNAN
jgi:hypothetical protein